MKLKDDPRISSVTFSEETNSVSILMVNKDQKTLKVYDRTRIKVETTTEFPLDLKITLVLTEEDELEYLSLSANKSLS